MNRLVSVISLVTFVVLSFGFADELFARKRYRRVYRRSRTVTIKRGGRIKKVPTNTYYSPYREYNYRLLPNWPVKSVENTRGIQYLWKVEDDFKKGQRTHGRGRVSPKRPYPNDVKAIEINDFEDNFHGRR